VIIVARSKTLRLIPGDPLNENHSWFNHTEKSIRPVTRIQSPALLECFVDGILLAPGNVQDAVTGTEILLR
jgi:hypothetical protein